MRLSISEDARRVSADCFRVVVLTTEIQNEAEVVKPVLDEVEVIRLSSALGLLPSVTQKDFEHALIPPEEFDDEFVHYLRRALLRGGDAVDADAVATLGLFGKQQEVKRALTRFGLWSAELEKGLRSKTKGSTVPNAQVARRRWCLRKRRRSCCSRGSKTPCSIRRGCATRRLMCSAFLRA